MTFGIVVLPTPWSEQGKLQECLTKLRLDLSGLVAGDSAICGRLAALILRCGLRVCDLRSSDHL